jgi:hypothetical protein
MFDAFGDESCGLKFVSYGLVCLPQHRREDAEQMISAVKKEFGGPSSSRLHCRELFSGQNRPKTAWKHLSPNDVVLLYKTLFVKLKGVDCRCIVAFGRKSDFPESLSPSEMEHVDRVAAKSPSKKFMSFYKAVAT